MYSFLQNLLSQFFKSAGPILGHAALEGTLRVPGITWPHTTFIITQLFFELQLHKSKKIMQCVLSDQSQLYNRPHNCMMRMSAIVYDNLTNICKKNSVGKLLIVMYLPQTVVLSWLVSFLPQLPIMLYCSQVNRQENQLSVTQME